MLEAFVDQNSFFWELFITSMMFAFVFQRRSRYALRLAVSFALGLIVSMLIPTQPELGASLPPMSRILLYSLYPRYVILFLVCFSAVRFCLDCSPWEAVFATVSGYCIQHIIYKTYDCLNEAVILLTSVETARYLIYAISRFIIAHAFFALYWFLYVKKLKSLGGFKINNKYMVVLAVVAVSAANMLNAIFYTMYVTYPDDGERPLFLVVYAAFPLLVCFLCLFALLDSTYGATTSANLLISQSLYDKTRAQYEISKQNADRINIKYHDLKRFLENSTYSREASRDIRHAVEQYEALPKTGNNAVNIVLSEKLGEMKAEGIEFRSNINAEPLGFMHGTDIYSFLSNLLSNAIEYLKTDGSAERYIALDIVKSGEMVKIRQENAVSAPITVDRESGLPQTTKEDRENHGFGVKSMTEVVSKYGGNILFDSKGGKFTVVALIPIP